MKKGFSVSMDIEVLSRIDDFRGLSSRSTFIEHLCEKQLDIMSEKKEG